jgi:Double zinc ribbon
MPPFAYFGIESSGLNLAVDLLIVFVVVTYLSLIYWTYMDARRRIVDQMLVGCATAASLFPFVGTIVYVILRPPEYLEDVRERELEMQAAAARLHDLDSSLCPHCDYRIERDFIRCPSCLRKLKERCVSCQRPLDQAWAICPYCETEVPGAAPPRRRRRRRPQLDEDRTEVGAPLLEGEHALPSAATLAGEAALRGDAAGVFGEEAPERPRSASSRRGGSPGEEQVAASEPLPSRRTGRAPGPRTTS